MIKKNIKILKHQHFEIIIINNKVTEIIIKIDVLIFIHKVYILIPS